MFFTLCECFPSFSPSPRTPAKWPPTAARRPLRCAKWPPPKAERPPRPEGSPRTTAKWPPPKIGRPPRPEGSPRTPARQRSACLTEGACLIEGASTAFPTECHTEFPTDDFTECNPSTKTNSDQNHNNKKVIQQNTNNILLGSAPLPAPSPRIKPLWSEFCKKMTPRAFSRRNFEKRRPLARFLVGI